MKYLLLFFFILCLLTSCERDDEVYSSGNTDGVQITTLLRISSISKIQIEADSLTITTIEIALHPEADSSARNIFFTTSRGLFSNGRQSDSIRANSYGIAKIDLISNEFGDARITIQSKSVLIDTSIVFQQSLADDMLMSADKYVGDTTESFTIYNSLFRNPGRGKISDPLKVFYSITADNVSSPALIFPPFSFSANKTSSIEILNPLKGKGRYKIEAKTVSASNINDTIRRNIFIEIQ